MEFEQYKTDRELITKEVHIDCFVHYEDTKELYLIQNKYNDLQTIVKCELPAKLSLE